MTAEVLAWRWSSWCNTVYLFRFPVNAGSHLKVLDNYTSVDVWWVSWKKLWFAAFVVRSFFDQLELSRANELCGLRRYLNPIGLSCRVELSLVCVDVLIQPACVLFSFLFFFLCAWF